MTRRARHLALLASITLAANAAAAACGSSGDHASTPSDGDASGDRSTAGDRDSTNDDASDAASHAASDAQSEVMVAAPGCIVPPPNVLTDAVGVSLGDVHSCAVRANGDLVCWGGNNFGVLGRPVGLGVDGGVNEAFQPLTIHFPTDAGAVKVTAVAAGFDSTCAVDDQKRVWCLGRNDSGQLGIGTTDNVAHPVPALVAYQGAPLLASSISVDALFACAVRADASPTEIVCWGGNSASPGTLGQLNNPRAGSPVPIPVNVLDASAFGAGPTLTSGPDNVSVCAFGGEAGTAACWGWNYGQVFSAPATLNVQYDLNVPLVSEGGAPPFQVSSGVDHACARDVSGALFCWGHNYLGDLGPAGPTDGFAPTTPTPLLIPGAPTALAVSAGSTHTCLLATGGRVFCFGDNRLGALGRGAFDPDASVPDPAPVLNTDATAPLGGVTGVVSGVIVTCARLTSCSGGPGGPVACWGQNRYGQLGTQGGVLPPIAGFGAYASPIPLLVAAPVP